MTVAHLRKLLKGLPSDMEVLMTVGEVLIPVCREKSEVAEAHIDDEIEEVLILLPCTCHLEVEPIEEERLN